MRIYIVYKENRRWRSDILREIEFRIVRSCRYDVEFFELMQHLDFIGDYFVYEAFHVNPPRAKFLARV